MLAEDSRSAHHVTVAALFADSCGIYASFDNVDVWDITRDARRYAGPYPVVAHPPCQRWGALAHVNYARWGGEHIRPGNDHGCFQAALAAVRMYGGVLEHPQNSRAWTHHHIATPTSRGWCQIGAHEWTCVVWQSAYGHRANKATRLLYVGESPPQEMRWDRPRGTHQVGYRDSRRKTPTEKPTLSRKEAAATPYDFAVALIELAKKSGVGREDLGESSGGAYVYDL